MSTEQEREKSTESMLRDALLVGNTHATSELKTLLDEAKKHAEGLKAYIDLAESLQQKQDEVSGLRQQMEQQSDYQQLKAEAPVLRAEQAVFAEIFPDDILAVFGIADRSALAQPDNQKLLPAILALLTFVRWSKEEDAENFVAEFRKVDAAVWAILQDDERLDRVRESIKKTVWDSVDRNLRACFKVDWGFVGSASNDEQHVVDGTGTEITQVKTALITLDGAVKDKACVVCQ